MGKLTGSTALAAATATVPLPLPLPLPCQIYNGDFDASVPWIADEAWTDGLGYDTEEEWRPWLVQGVTAGG
jgi:hypothetical protein